MTEIKQASIVPLKGPNYATWKVQCTMALKKDGVMSGTETAPPTSADQKEWERYVGRQDKALATIVLSVVLYLIGDPVDPVVVWKKLEEQFQKKSWVNRLNLRRELHSKDDESVQEHVKTMLETFNELSIVGDTITDEDRVVYLLASLPDSFNTFLVTALESSTTVPAMEAVIERLMHEERKLQDREPSSESGVDGALTAKHRTRSKKPRCYACQRFGHIQRNCPERCARSSNHESKSSEHAKPGRKKNRKVNEIYQTQVERSDSETESNVTMIGLVTRQVLSVADYSETDSWIIDSGATCNDQKLFIEFRTLRKPQDVTLGDGHVLSATGIGKVDLVKNEQVKYGRLQNVLYVPKLAYNLLSVSKITEAGKRVQFYSNHCQVLDQRDKVVAVGVKKGDLYYLSCQQPQRNLKDQAHISDARLNATSKELIWHQRFGHLNERGLHILKGQMLVDGFDYNTSEQLPFCRRVSFTEIPFEVLTS